MSATRSMGDCTNTHTIPPSPIRLTTRFGDVPPAVRFRLDAVGRSAPHAHTVSNPATAAFVPVTLSTAAEAFAGTCDVPTPVTLIATVAPAAGFGPVNPVRPSRRV